jgi:hypothetical protein
VSGKTGSSARAKTASGGYDVLGNDQRCPASRNAAAKDGRKRENDGDDRVVRRTNAGSLTVDASPEMIKKDQLEVVQG